MIRVLQVVPFNNGIQGGIENLVMNIYRRIDRENIQFDFLTYGNPSAMENEIRALGGKVYKLSSRRKGILKSRKETLDFFRSHAEDYKIVHLHICSASNILTLKYKGTVPVSIVHSHASQVINPTVILYPISFLLHRINRRYIVKHADYMFACSRMAAVHMYGEKILKDSRYRFFYNGIEAEKFKFTASSRKEMRKKYQIKEDERIIGFVGRFEAVKNIPFLIHVFYEISQSNPQRYHLLMVGDGTLQKEIKTLVKKLNLQEKVIFAGVQEDVVPFFHMMDVFVLTSKNEGFSIVTLEAQAAGCPCVCASTLPKEVNVCGNVKFISLKKSYAEWAETIERIAEEIGDRQVTVQKLVDSHYDIESTVEYISSFYKDC